MVAQTAPRGLRPLVPSLLRPTHHASHLVRRHRVYSVAAAAGHSGSPGGDESIGRMGGTNMDTRQREARKRTFQHNKLIDLCAKSQDITGAEKLLLRMPGEKILPDESSHVAVIAACASVGDAWRAEAWLRRMKVSGILANVEAFSSTIDAHIRASDRVAAESVLARMYEAEVEPNAKSYGPLLHACTLPHGGGAVRAQRLLAEMQAAEVKPDAISYSSLLNCYARDGDWDNVDQVMDDMTNSGLRMATASYASLVSACAQARDVAQELPRAERFIDRAISDGLTPSLSLLNAMLNVCARAGEVGSAKVWLQRISSRYSLTADAISYNTTLNACARGNDAIAAEGVLQQMTDAGFKPDIVSYTALIQACGRSKRSEPAERWLLRMLDAGLRPDFVIFNTTLQACAKSDDLLRLWRVYERMRSEGVTPDAATFTTLAIPYARRGDIEKVENLFREFRSLGHNPGTWEYACLISAYAHASPRQSDNAERAFREMLVSGLEANTHVLKFLRNALGEQRLNGLLKDVNITPPKEISRPHSDQRRTRQPRDVKKSQDQKS